jgi:hypothetical protein
MYAHQQSMHKHVKRVPPVGCLTGWDCVSVFHGVGLEPGWILKVSFGYAFGWGHGWALPLVTGQGWAEGSWLGFLSEFCLGEDDFWN